MRKLIVISILICVICGAAAAKDTPVRVYVDGRLAKLSPPAMMRDGKTYVGLRGIATALGATTRWVGKSKTAIVTVGNKRTRVHHSKGIMVNGVLFLPLRTTSEAVGCSVLWDSSSRAIRITPEAPCPSGGG